MTRSNLMDDPGSHDIDPRILSTIAGRGISDTAGAVLRAFMAGHDDQAARIEACGLESAAALEIYRREIE